MHALGTNAKPLQPNSILVALCDSNGVTLSFFERITNLRLGPSERAGEPFFAIGG